MKLVAFSSTGMKAWIEDRDDVAHLLIASPDGPIVVESAMNQQDSENYGYEGCSVSYVAWHGERLVAISEEERVCGLRSIALDGSIATVNIDRPHLVVGDVALSISREAPGLLATHALPSLSPLSPLPCSLVSSRRAILRSEAGALVVARETDSSAVTVLDRVPLPTTSSLAFPPSRDEFLRDVERALFGALGSPPELIDVRFIIEASALSLATSTLPRASVAWWPAYLHRHLTSTGDIDGAARLLRQLDSIAAIACASTMGATREQQAAQHVTRRAALLAQTCRSGKLPELWWSLGFDAETDVASLTPSLSRAFAILRTASQPCLPWI